MMGDFFENHPFWNFFFQIDTEVSLETKKRMMSFVLYLVLASFVTTSNAQFGRSIAVTEKTIKGEVNI